MIYNATEDLYEDDFGIGGVTLMPACHATEETAALVTITWDADADEEEVDQRLETWAGLPCLSWFRLKLSHVDEADYGVSMHGEEPAHRVLSGYVDARTARELRENSVVYQRAYGDRTPHDGR